MQNSKKIIQFHSKYYHLNKRSTVYKILKAHPTKEQITNFNMKIAEEDDYVDYVIDLNTLDEDAKKELCSLYDIDDKDLNQKEKLQLSISSSV